MRIQAFVAILGLTFSVAALAAPITFTQSGSGSGALAGSSFFNAAFTITAVGDTDNRTSFPAPFSGFRIEHDSASINIAGLGVLQFVTATETFVNNGEGKAGFASLFAPALPLNLFETPTDPVFSTWDMVTSIGPITGLGKLQGWFFFPVITNAGQLVFDAAETTATFQASVGSVPEPGTLTLVSILLVALGFEVGRKSRSDRESGLAEGTRSNAGWAS